MSNDILFMLRNDFRLKPGVERSLQQEFIWSSADYSTAVTYCRSSWDSLYQTLVENTLWYA